MIVLPYSEGRFTSLGIEERNKPVLAKKKMRDDQIFDLHTLMNHVKDGEGKMIPRTAKRIYGNWISEDLSAGAGAPIFTTVTDENDEITKRVIEKMKDVRYIKHWGRKARHMLENDKRKEDEKAQSKSSHPIKRQPIMKT